MTTTTTTTATITTFFAGAAAALAAGAALFYTFGSTPTIPLCQETSPDPTTPQEWLMLATQRMKKVLPPIQSNFRVYAILTWKDSTNNMTGWVSGTNSESSFIGGSLCAERAAAVQLRELPASIQVTAVYLCSDLLEIPITPGVLCREYLLSCVSPDIPVWMATADLSTIRSSTLRALYPYPNMYENIKRDKLEHFGRQCCATTTAVRASDHFPSEDVPSKKKWLQLMALAQKASSKDVLGGKMHPCLYGAAIEFDDGSIRVSWQKAGLEYGTTVDSVTSLLRDIDNNNNSSNNHNNKKREAIKPIKLVQVDQFQNLIAPFAPARAQLYERGYDCLQVAVMEVPSGIRKVVTVASLVPDCPKMSEIW